MERDRRIVILGGGCGPGGQGVPRDGRASARFGPKRVVAPLAESLSLACPCLAAADRIPVREIKFEGFLHLALDQIYNQVARFRTRSRGRWGLGLVLRVPWGGGIHAPELHSESPETLLVHAPGLIVVTPSNPYDAKGLLISALRLGEPVVFCEPKRIYRAVKAEVPEGEYTVPIGRAAIAREGRDLTIVAWGAMVREVLKAAEELETEGFSAEVVDLRTLSPMDSATVVESVRKTGRLVVAHEAPRTLGLGAEIAARVGEEALTSLLAPIERVAGFDTVMPLAQLEEHYLPGHRRIMAGAKRTLAA